MDSITQGLLGAAAGQACDPKRRLGAKATWLGALAGMAADLDIVLRDASDPLVAWTYHRHFTHSLAFIPLGGLMCALPFFVRERDPTRRRAIFGVCLAGYATHALLDACTAYGTMLGWPFSHAKVAWNTVSIIDPIYSFALLAGIVLGWRRRSSRPALLALALSSGYLAFGAVLRDRVIAATRLAAAARGLPFERVEAFPELGQNLVWRVLLVDEDRIHAAAARTPWWGSTADVEVQLGASARRARPSTILAEDPELDRDPRARDALFFFDWFAMTCAIQDPSDPRTFFDGRYSSDPTAFQPLWGLRLAPGQEPPYSQLRPAYEMGPAFRRHVARVVGPLTP